jgi:hypothetical protein
VAKLWATNSATIFSNPDKAFLARFHALSAYIKSVTTTAAMEDLIEVR